MKSFRYMALFTILTAFIPVWIYAGDATSIADTFCGEWKGDDGNIHSISTDTWTITLPNELKKVKTFKVSRITEPKGIWVTISPIELYFFKIISNKKIECLGPVHEIGHTDQLPLVTTLHASSVNLADSRKLVKEYHERIAAAAPIVARKRIATIAATIASAESEISVREFQIQDIRKSPRKLSPTVLGAMQGLSAEVIAERERVANEDQIKEHEKWITIRKNAIIEAQQKITAIGKKDNVPSEECKQVIERARTENKPFDLNRL